MVQSSRQLIQGFNVQGGAVSLPKSSIKFGDCGWWKILCVLGVILACLAWNLFRFAQRGRFTPGSPRGRQVRQGGFFGLKEEKGDGLGFPKRVQIVLGIVYDGKFFALLAWSWRSWREIFSLCSRREVHARLAKGSQSSPRFWNHKDHLIRWISGSDIYAHCLNRWSIWWNDGDDESLKNVLWEAGRFMGGALSLPKCLWVYGFKRLIVESTSKSQFSTNEHKCTQMNTN